MNRPEHAVQVRSVDYTVWSHHVIHAIYGKND